MDRSSGTETINSLGFVEVKGLCAALQTADAMLKCASVRLLRQLLRDPQLITLVVEGELGACSAAVEVGRAEAERLEAFVAGRVMGRPARDTADFVLRLAEAGRQPFGSAVQAAPARNPAPLAGRAPEASHSPLAPDGCDPLDVRLLEVLRAKPEGYATSQLSKLLGEKIAHVRARLDVLCQNGSVQKQGARYVIVEGGAR